VRPVIIATAVRSLPLGHVPFDTPPSDPVVKRFPSPVRSRFAFPRTLIVSGPGLMLMLSSLSCTPGPLSAEAGWREQIAAVAAGQSAEIRYPGPLDRADFAAIAAAGSNLESLWLEGDRLQADDLRELEHLPNLRALRLSSEVSSRGLAEIAAAAPRLERLNLPHAAFDDAGMATLVEGLPLLIQLRFGSPRVSDEGVAELAALPALTYLHLIEVPLTDRGLAAIAEIESLESFYLDGGDVTDEGLARLIEERPDLHFHRDQQHLVSDPLYGHE
jgi:hypothetical protein